MTSACGRRAGRPPLGAAGCAIAGWSLLLGGVALVNPVLVGLGMALVWMEAHPPCTYRCAPEAVVVPAAEPWSRAFGALALTILIVAGVLFVVLHT